MKDLKDLTPEQIDLFREISNIGAGNAATAMSNILDKDITMGVPKINILPFAKVAELFNGAESVVIGVLVNMSGDLNGYMLFIQEIPHANTILSILMGEKRQQENSFDFNEIELSALQEIANILIGSYLSAISSMTDLKIVASVPQLTIDMAGAILSVPTVEYGQIGDSVIFMETALADKNHEVGIHFFLIPDIGSFDILMRALGVMSE